jgi:hypothetical protein
VDTVLRCSGENCDKRIVVNAPVSAGATFSCRNHTKGKGAHLKVTDLRHRLSLMIDGDPEMRDVYGAYVTDWQERVVQFQRIAASGQVGHFAGASGRGDHNR